MLTFNDVKPGDYFLLGNAKKISWFVEDRQGDTLTLRNSLGNQQVMVIPNNDKDLPITLIERHVSFTKQDLAQGIM